MPFIQLPDDRQTADLRRTEELIIAAISGVERSIGAQACILVGVAIWKLGGVTREQAKQVAVAAIDGCISERTN
jgi:hypothetical protein